MQYVRIMPLIAILLSLSGCDPSSLISEEDDSDGALITVETKAVYGITAEEAYCNGFIFEVYGTQVLNYGVEYSKGFGGTPQQVLTPEDGFTFKITNLEPETTYYARAFATNENGISYGNSIMFETKDESWIKKCTPTKNYMNFFDKPYNFYPTTRNIDIGRAKYEISSSDGLSFQFTHKPESGIYTCIGSNSLGSNGPQSRFECTVDGNLRPFGSYISYWYVGQSNQPVFVEKLGEDKYSITLCNFTFNGTSTPDFLDKFVTSTNMSME